VTVAGAFMVTAPGLAPSLAAFGVVLGLMLALELTPIELPGGGHATTSAVVDLPAIVLLGPYWTAIAGVVSIGLSQGVVHRRSPAKVLHDMMVGAITVLAAGGVWQAAGGSAGQSFVEALAPLLALGAAYFAVHSALSALAVGLTRGPNPWRVWERNFLDGIIHHVSFVALGILAAVTYQVAGRWGLVLFAIPFVVARHSFRLYVEIRSDLKDFVRAFSEVLEEVDPYTRHHSARVSQYAVRLARELGLAERDVEEVEYAALVHDLGKIGPQHQHILQKPGTLSHEEQRTLRAHPAAGAEIVRKVRALRRPAEIVRAHHERPDGQGYPFGLQSEDVPMGARILNVADAFDAMTSDRPYRRALSVRAALDELRRGAGTQFDAQVVATLLRMYEQGRFPLLPSPSSEDLQQLRVRPLRLRA
jgi:putative nucleotidyltransferase with HDIG domain